MSQFGRLTADPVQSPGLLESEYGRKHSSNGHRSMTSAHSDGIILGLLLGFCVSSIMTVAAVGSGDGTGDGNGVGLQSSRSRAPIHSVGQHCGQPSSSNGKISQSCLPKSTHNGSCRNGSTSKHTVGHSSIKYEHSVGMDVGVGLGRSVGNNVGPGDGIGEGRSVGLDDGTDDGKAVGPGDGICEGRGVGLQSIRS